MPYVEWIVHRIQERHRHENILRAAAHARTRTRSSHSTRRVRTRRLSCCVAHTFVAIADSRGLSAAALCARILDTIRQYRGSRQDQDDVTALVVRAL